MVPRSRFAEAKIILEVDFSRSLSLNPYGA